MKKALYITLGVIFFLLISAVAVPFLFKDQIIQRINRELDNSLNAQVYYDPDEISISLLRHFPNVSATIGDFGIVGKDEFAADTLIQVDELDLAFNLKSIIFDDTPSLTALSLIGGDLYIKVLEDGTANYDIVKEDSTQSTEASESSFQLGIESIELDKVNLIYDDRQMQFAMALAEISAKGSGDFTLDVYDLPLQVEATIADLAYEGVHYLTNKKFEGETTLQVDLNQMKFTLTEGTFGLNDFYFGLDGYLALPEDGMDMDLSFAASDSEFKSILSLVPGIYTESFSSVKTSGTMAFDGYVKGRYTETQLPTFAINLKVEDGMFQYPDLPKPVQAINLQLQAKNETSELENTSLDIPTFSLKFGSNPISGNFHLANLRDYEMEGQLVGKLNLQELTSIFPIEGTELAGILDLNAEAKGRYDSANHILPSITAKMALANGYAKNTTYPTALEDIHATAMISSSSGQMKDFVADFPDFGFELEGEEISGKMRIEDFEALNWDGALTGAVDLEKILTIFPIENTQLKGKIQADIQTAGSYQAVEQKQYGKLNTSGTMQVQDFFFQSQDYPQGVAITKANASFSPAQASLNELDAKLGKSPLQASGSLSNYMDYLLSDAGVLKGQLDLKSSHFDVNEWMTESSTGSDTSSMEVLALPDNIDFTMAVAADEVLYDNLNLKEVRGKMTLRNGVLTFSDAGMKTLDGRITLNGNYDPRDLANPKFDMKLDISELSIAKAFQSLTTVKAFAPIAQDITGRFNSQLEFSGLLGSDMMPVLSSLDVNGILAVLDAALKESKMLQSVTSLTKLPSGSSLQFKDLKIPVHIEDGIMEVQPFDVKLWDYQTRVQGSAGFDGSINYLLNMQVPAGKFGAQANALLASIAGTQANESTIIPLAINLSGTYKSPKVSLAGGNSIENLLSNALQSRLESEKQNLTAEAQKQFDAAQDSIKQELKVKAQAFQDSVKKELEKKSAESGEKVVEEAKNLLKGILKSSTQTKKDTTVKKDN